MAIEVVVAEPEQFDGEAFGALLQYPGASGEVRDHRQIAQRIQDNKGLVVRPEGCEMDFVIKKSQIAINAADARPARFTGGERIDCAISDLDLNKRKVNLSIKLLEEI